MAFQKAQKILQFFQNNPNLSFERQIVQHSTLISAQYTEGRVSLQFQLPVLPQFLNRYGTLHGGAITTIIDQLTGITVNTADRSTRKISSVQLSPSFLAPCSLNQVITVKTTCNKVGNTLGFAYAQIRQNNTILATGKHTVFLFPETLEVNFQQ